MFNKTYDSLKGQSFNSALGRTAKGRKILKTLDEFRVISKNEEKIQNAITDYKPLKHFEMDLPFGKYKTSNFRV